MPSTDADDPAASSDGTEQTALDRFTSPQRCAAISVSTSKRCEHDALPGVPYCADHYDRLDDVDATETSTTPRGRSDS